MSVPALGIAPVADEKVHADPTDSIGRSALMTQLTKPADEMLQVRFMKFDKNKFCLITLIIYQRLIEACVVMLLFHSLCW